MNEEASSSPNPLSGLPGPSSITERAPIKTKISLRVPTISTPFYTMKPTLPAPSPLLGSMDLIEMYDLSRAYNKFCSSYGNKRIAKEDLSTFLPHLYGDFDWKRGQDISWLKMLVDKPPITGKEIVPLNASAIASFKLTPGQVDEQYQWCFDRNAMKNKEKESGGEDKGKKPKERRRTHFFDSEKTDPDLWMLEQSPADPFDEPEKKKHKKDKEKDKDREGEGGSGEKKAKKKKKEKKNKKEKEERL